MMHGHANIKFISTKQAKGIHPRRNTKRLYGTIAAVWYNNVCRDKQLTPNYIVIKINGNNRQCTNTLRAATHFRQHRRYNYTTSCKHNLVLLTMGEIIAPKHVQLIVIINKNLLLLHLVGCLYYCTFKGKMLQQLVCLFTAVL
jgi:hypothetical protein